jgi:hypothetical protein
MLASSRKLLMFIRKKFSSGQLSFLLYILFSIFLMAACNPTPTKELYNNPETCVSLEKFTNWNLAYYERSNIIVIEPEAEKNNGSSVRVEIYGYACAATPVWFEGPKEEVHSHITRIANLYNLSSVTVIQEPFETKIDSTTVAKAVISIPTTSLPEDDVVNQWGVADPELSQTITIFGIQDRNRHFVSAFIYSGSNDALNAEAEEIIASIEFAYPSEP